jgi:hypothetical protein
LLQILILWICRSKVVRVARVTSALALLGGCSPTFQSLYESDVHFEHCYRVDEERHVAIKEKLQCWRDWSQRYSYGQSRDRIGYARGRQETLSQALAAGEKAAPQGIAEGPKGLLPQPTSPYAPPPQLMTPASAKADTGTIVAPLRAAAATDAGATEGAIASTNAALRTDTVAVVDAPGASCAGACGKTWSSCKQQCKGGTCRADCDDRYRGCMRACF